MYKFDFVGTEVTTLFLLDRDAY